jgi:hypothetical protein
MLDLAKDDPGGAGTIFRTPYPIEVVPAFFTNKAKALAGGSNPRAALFVREDRHPQAVDADVVKLASEPLLLRQACRKVAVPHPHPKKIVSDEMLV